jgi:hypothetical protein
MKPGTQRVLNPEATSFVDQDQKGGVEGVMGVVGLRSRAWQTRRTIGPSRSTKSENAISDCSPSRLVKRSSNCFSDITPVAPELEKGPELPGSSSARPKR